MQDGRQRLALLPDRTLMLLSEITASTSRCGGGESDEAALLRLMADPLLLRDHLMVRGGAEPGKVGPIYRMGQRLLSEISLPGLTSTLSTQAGDHRYLPVAPGPADSLRPERFVVTREDRILALENGTGSCREATDSWPGGGATVSPPMLKACLLLLLVVLMFAGLVAVLLN